MIKLKCDYSSLAEMFGRSRDPITSGEHRGCGRRRTNKLTELENREVACSRREVGTSRCSLHGTTLRDADADADDDVVVDVERYVKLADLCATELAHEATRRIPTQV
ncbi:hypothetical protein ANTQUA_LOCUS10323 [Anthophora quadrimaculata]